MDEWESKILMCTNIKELMEISAQIKKDTEIELTDKAMIHWQTYLIRKQIEEERKQIEEETNLNLQKKAEKLGQLCLKVQNIIQILKM